MNPAQESGHLGEFLLGDLQYFNSVVDSGCYCRNADKIRNFNLDMFSNLVVFVEFRHGIVDFNVKTGSFQFAGNIDKTEVGPSAC